MTTLCKGCKLAEALPGYGCGKLCAMCIMIGPPKRVKSSDGLGSRSKIKPKPIKSAP